MPLVWSLFGLPTKLNVGVCVRPDYAAPQDLRETSEEPNLPGFVMVVLSAHDPTFCFPFLAFPRPSGNPPVEPTW
jgi:hypothetical protein